MHVKQIVPLAVVCLGLLLPPSLAQAEVVHDTFFVELGLDNVVNQDPAASGGSGFQGGTWFEYTDPAGGPNWWNQWFFNSPEILGSKWIAWNISLGPETLDVTKAGIVGVTFTQPTSVVELAINYSNQNWLDPILPPLPGQDQFIVRESIFTGPPYGTIDNRNDPFLIPDFNPIWVSIDIRVLTSGQNNGDIRILDAENGPVLARGEIWHEHHPIPEPTAFVIWSLLGVCMASALQWRRKRAA